MTEQNYQVIYRKYRPSNFSEVVGQDMIIQTLKNALAMGRIAHAYLFTGPRGTGKTTVARILAKAVSCLSRQSDGEPCNKCQACKEISAGRAIDLVEIDAASNRGIDEIRELREGIKFAPGQLRYKFFIIDECHMLTREAFNALLKTLEEPPAHAIFVLATTEAHKLPETILSRCQRFDFRKLTIAKMVNRLGQIIFKEKIKTEKGVLELIAFNAEGGMRDAESLLGQLMALGSVSKDNLIALDEVKTFLGVTDTGALFKMGEYLTDKNAKAAIELISKIIDDGYDFEHYVKSLINYLRQMMLLKTDSSLASFITSELTDEQIKIMLDQSSRLSLAESVELIRLLISASNEMRFAPFAQLPIELAIIEFITKENNH